MLELRYIVAMMVKMYDYEIPEGTVVKKFYSATLKPEGELPIIFKKRSL